MRQLHQRIRSTDNSCRRCRWIGRGITSSTGFVCLILSAEQTISTNMKLFS